MAATHWDEATFEAHRPLLFSIAYRMLGSASEAEDVVQDAWVRALQDEHADVRCRQDALTFHVVVGSPRGSAVKQTYKPRRPAATPRREAVNLPQAIAGTV